MSCVYIRSLKTQAACSIRFARTVTRSTHQHAQSNGHIVGTRYIGCSETQTARQQLRKKRTSDRRSEGSITRPGSKMMSNTWSVLRHYGSPRRACGNTAIFLETVRPITESTVYLYYVYRTPKISRGAAPVRVYIDTQKSTYSDARREDRAQSVAAHVRVWMITVSVGAGLSPDLPVAYLSFDNPLQSNFKLLMQVLWFSRIHFIHMLIRVQLHLKLFIIVAFTINLRCFFFCLKENP